MAKRMITRKLGQMLLVLTIVIGQLGVIPLAASAESDEPIVELETEQESDTLIEESETADVEVELAPEEEVVSESDQEESSEADDTYAEEPEEAEVFMGIEATNTRLPHSGVVQFELRPTSWPAGVTEA